MLYNIKKCVLLIICCLGFIFASGCDETKDSDKADNEVTSDSEIMVEKEIVDSEVVRKYFNDRGLEISEAVIEKRQTNKSEKQDIVYMKITSENDVAILNGTYVIENSYFDVGGWNVMSIYSENDTVYEPKDKPQIDFDFDEIIEWNKVDDYTYIVTYVINRSGSVANITETYQRKYIFDSESISWVYEYGSMEKIDFLIMMNISEAMYEYKCKYGNVGTIFDDHMYYIEFYGKEAKLTLCQYINKEFTYSDKGWAVIKESEDGYYFEFNNNWRNIFIYVESDCLYGYEGVTTGSKIELLPTENY